MDLRIEQLAIHWETTRGHMRRQDRAGKGLFITAHDTQIETGSSVPFHELDPRRCDYTTDKTRWRYIWTESHSIGINIKMYSIWTPQPSNVNDRNIMEVAMEDEILRASKWPLLKHVNMCRLFMRIFYISDMSMDGKRVHKSYLDGTQRSTKYPIEFPEMIAPTNNQWKIWKEFIFRNFLSPGTTINPNLGEVCTEQRTPSIPESEVEQMARTMEEDSTLHEMVEVLPRSLRLLVGEITLPRDGGNALGESVVDGTCVGASDGSLVRDYTETKGSHGYVLSSTNPEVGEIAGWGPSPESDEMSSMTTEHFGLIGLLVTLHLLCKKFKLTEDECFDSVLIYIDNKTVVERGTEKQELINLSDYAVPDQGLWSLTTELINKLPIKIEIRWVKGHQDENRFGEKIHGPFKKEVMMNIQVDKFARRGMEMGVGKTTIKPVLSTEVIALYTKNEVQITNLRKYIVRTKNGKELEQFLKDKKGWDDEIFNDVEWEGIESLLKSAGPNRRTRLVQLLHNWQNVGAQKGRFRDSRLRLDSDNPLNPTEEEVDCHKCQEGCDEVESNLHYLECPTTHSRERRLVGIKKVIQRLKKLRTYEGITSLVGYILKCICNREEMVFDWETLNHDGDMSLIISLQGQEKIGWTSLCQGYYHKGWAITQSKYYRRLGSNTRTLNIRRWKKMFSTIMTDYSLDCWKERNETIHGKEKDKSRQKQLITIRKQVRGLYARRGELHGHPNKKIYDMPMKKRLRMGIQSTKIWVGLAEEVLRLHRENATKNTLHHWLQP